MKLKPRTLQAKTTVDQLTGILALVISLLKRPGPALIAAASARPLAICQQIADDRPLSGQAEASGTARLAPCMLRGSDNHRCMTAITPTDVRTLHVC